jgi:tetratricopeptide (TPR) repeat protein
MKTLSWRLACLITVFLPLCASAADTPWLEVRSLHFRVLSDGSENEARVIAGRFEQIRSAFVLTMPGLRLDLPVPFLILAPKDESSLKALFPERWKQKGVKPAGFFITGSEKSLAVVQLNLERRQSAQAADEGYQVVYHEYTHSVLNANFRWLPLWVNEGMAEFFGNTWFTGGEILLGAPNIRAEYTRGRPLIPLEKLIGITVTSPEYVDEDKVQLFYSQSWGLLHSLLLSSAMDSGKRLQQFLTLLEKGVAQPEAFRQAIGDFKAVEAQLKRYLDQDSPEVFAISNPSPVTADTFTLRRLASAESNAELGAVQAWLHENSAARARLEQPLKSGPAMGLAAEAMGFLKFSEGKDSEAHELFARALDANPKLYLSAYYRAMLSPAARSDTAEARTALRAALNQVVELNSEFAPAYAQLAAGYMREGLFDNALGPALKAQQLWPSRAGYHILIGNILHALGRDAEAAAVARYVAERWQDMDRDAAVDLWARLSLEARKGADFPKRASMPRAQVIQGKIDSVACRDKGRTMRVVIDGTPLTLRVNEDKIRTAVSDTVWFGKDHFDRCHHVAGLRAVIQYIPARGSGSAGELVQFEVSDIF